MIKEVRESLDEAREAGVLSEELDFPLAELLICAGRLNIQT